MEQPRFKAVVEVVIQIGDFVGDVDDLRFERCVAGPFKIFAGGLVVLAGVFCNSLKYLER